MFKYTLMFISGVATILFLMGYMFTAFRSDPVPDYIEQALEEVTRKRKRK